MGLRISTGLRKVAGNKKMGKTAVLLEKALLKLTYITWMTNDCVVYHNLIITLKCTSSSKMKMKKAIQ